MLDLLFEHVSLMDETGALVTDRYVGVRGDMIAYLGPDKPEEDAVRTIDGAHRCMLPGFVNTHCHVPMTLLRGYGEGLCLQDWLFTRILSLIHISVTRERAPSIGRESTIRL